MDFKNKKVLVLGLARSGYSAACVLKKHGANVWVSDVQDTPKIRELARDLKEKGIKVETGGHTLGFIAAKDLIVISPGIRSDLPFLVKARALGIPVISEIELGYRLCPSPVIAVTGTNGKTTVTTLIGKVLEQAGRHAVVCGNIGNSFTGELAKLNKESFAVLEVSSFQLETVNQFRPHVAVILNISPDHLDRYKTVQEYVQAKEIIFRNQTASDFALLNYQDKIVRGFQNKTKAKVVFFNQGENKEKGLNDNQKAVLKVGSVLRIAEEEILAVFRDFKGIEHRLEFVAEINGVKFINDSKATNIHSTVYALNSTPGKVILIAGGRDKGQDFSPLRAWLAEKVKYLLLIGEGAEKIGAAAGDRVAAKRLKSLEEAVEFAFKTARKGDLVLLSPMCASFDMFENYEHRGRVFKGAVLNLKKEKALSDA